MNRKLYQHIASRLSGVANCATDNPWRAKHIAAIDALVKNYMPSGSGFDNGTTLDYTKSTTERLVFITAFHHMDDNGSYCGWSDHTVTVTASLHLEINLSVGGRNVRDIKDMIHESFGMALRADVDDAQEFIRLAVETA